MSVIGFTGTQHGMNAEQLLTLASMMNLSEAVALTSGVVRWFHHGDCIGADAQADALAHHYGFKVAIHPPNVDNKRAFRRNADLMFPPASYLVRNHDIVNVCELLIACPNQNTEVMRSGTWATIRYARSIGRKTIIIWTDGSAS